MALSANNKSGRGRWIKGLVLALGFSAVAAATGCDELYSGLYGGYYPSYGYYDPTSTIQSVISYRQSVYEASNAGWGAYFQE
ncbi:MAG TPA: hypothetical protein PKY77_20595 [Phycisphaerae bacterium]|nr:hypothetical protein [Phycisphaerae bacterium]HRY71124.1 hypothetical protein [Phycisphaerae bacterium]HSA29466.1 hypothetical protein [Phycisphaerae bacterium]